VARRGVPTRDRTRRPADDARLAAALRKYQADLDAGRRPDRAALLAGHADIAGSLADAMDGPRLPVRGRPAEVPGRAGAATRRLPPVARDRPRRHGRRLRAEQVSLGRRVALKVLPTAAASTPANGWRFLHEAQAAAHLHHTNIVPVFAVGCDRGIDYYAMQYIDGPTLAEVIAG